MNFNNIVNNSIFTLKYRNIGNVIIKNKTPRKKSEFLVQEDESRGKEDSEKNNVQIKK